MDIGKSKKSQGAMEYLMTYGWAILIIAIVMVAIFQLHLFDPYTFSPKASTGSCQVIRPNGPRSNIFVSEIGEDCQTNEIPQYVAQFNGQTSKIVIQHLGNVNPPITFVAWILPESTNIETVVVYSNSSCGGDIYGIAVGSYGAHELDAITGCPAPTGSDLSLKSGQWYFVAATINSNKETFYLDNQNDSNTVATTTNSLPTFNLSIGSGYLAANNYFNGYISNIQIYNTTLSANEINAIYNEGIGGAPLDISNLAGWWPLNGNANDYSGNNENGNSIAVNFISNWENGYTAP